MEELRISPAGLALIKHFEGFSPTVYICPAGFPTIGYGHLVTAAERPLYEDRTISEDEATVLLQGDVAAACRAVGRLITARLVQPQFDALVDFTFNLGGGALQASTLRRKVNRGEHEAVPAELIKWVWGGTPPRRLKGLILRRQAEARMYATGTRPAAAPSSIIPWRIAA